MVATHFLLALVVLAGAMVVAVEAWGNAAGRVESPAPMWLKLAGLVLAGACGVLVVTGTLSTAAGPHPGDSAEIKRFWNLLDAVWIHVRATAAFGITFLLLLGWLARNRERAGVLVPGAVVLLALLLVQMTVGELQYRNQLPWWLVLIHVASRGSRLGLDGRPRHGPLAHPAYTDVMSELRMVGRPVLERPVLIAAFRGWNDGGQGATLAAGYLARVWHAERFGDIDPEGFVDFQANRPHVSLDEGMTRRIDWPENAFYHARIPGSDRDAILLLGVEPSLRWKTFSKLVIELARDLDVELVITLGSLLADVPHTRAAPVTGAASDPALVESLGLQHSRYEGPTGIVGVLQDSCRREGVPAASLWAAVPHYVSLAPSPRAARALCDRLGQLLGVEIDTAELEEAEESYAEQVSEAVSSDEETAAYVAELERRTDELDLEEHEDLPSGDSLAAELTRFLRERDAENGDDGPREQ